MTRAVIGGSNSGCKCTARDEVMPSPGVIGREREKIGKKYLHSRKANRVNVLFFLQ